MIVFCRFLTAHRPDVRLLAVELVERAQKGSTITINNLSTQAAGLQVESDAHGKAIKDLIAGQGKVAAQADETAKKVDDCAAKRDVDELRNQLRALMEAQQNQARKEQIRDDQMRGLRTSLSLSLLFSRVRCHCHLGLCCVVGVARAELCALPIARTDC